MKQLILPIIIFSAIKSFAQVGVNTTNPQGPLHVDGKSSGATTNSNTGTPDSTQMSDDFIIKNNGSTGIGTMPNANAMLDINSDNKGILIPRVVLASSTHDLNADNDNNIANQPVGLMVYNIGTQLAKGYYFWNGTEWRGIEHSTSIPANATINCNIAVIDPSQSIDATRAIISGSILKIPYTGGNGGKYNGATLTSTGNPNITATIADGKLEHGSGYLIFTLQGTPIASQNSPVGITFNLTPFLNANQNITGCNSVTVGTQATADYKVVSVIDYMKFVRDPDTQVYGYTVDCTTPDGLYTVKVFMRHSRNNTSTTPTATNNLTSVRSAAENNVLLRNNSTNTKTIMWNYSTFYGGQISSAGGGLPVPPQKPGGGIGNTWSDLANNNAGNWGDAGIYNAVNDGPEYRYYSWIDNSTNSKVAYIATIMAGMDPNATLTDPTKLKVFIRIEQITGM